MTVYGKGKFGSNRRQVGIPKRDVAFWGRRLGHVGLIPDRIPQVGCMKLFDQSVDNANIGDDAQTFETVCWNSLYYTDQLNTLNRNGAGGYDALYNDEFLKAIDLYEGYRVSSAEISARLRLNLGTNANFESGGYFILYRDEDDTATTPDWLDPVASKDKRQLDIEKMKRDPNAIWTYVRAADKDAKGNPDLAWVSTTVRTYDEGYRGTASTSTTVSMDESNGDNGLTQGSVNPIANSPSQVVKPRYVSVCFLSATNVTLTADSFKVDVYVDKNVILFDHPAEDEI